MPEHRHISAYVEVYHHAAFQRFRCQFCACNHCNPWVYLGKRPAQVSTLHSKKVLCAVMGDTSLDVNGNSYFRTLKPLAAPFTLERPCQARQPVVSSRLEQVLNSKPCLTTSKYPNCLGNPKHVPNEHTDPQAKSLKPLNN